MQTEEEPDVVLVKVEEGTRQTSLSIQEGEWMLTSRANAAYLDPCVRVARSWSCGTRLKSN